MQQQKPPKLPACAPTRRSLFQLLLLATKDDSPTPNLKYIQLVASRAHDPRNAAFITQHITNALRAYPHRFISSLQLYYNLCLLEYLILDGDFARHVVAPAFVGLLEKVAQFDVCSPPRGVFFRGSLPPLTARDPRACRSA